MKKYTLLVILLPFFISGCTTIYYPRIVSTSSALEQELKDNAAEQASKILLYNADYIKLEKQISEYIYSSYISPNKRISEQKIDDLRKELNNMNPFSEFFINMKNKKVYIDIQGPSGDNYLLRNYIAKRLQWVDIPIVDKDKNPDLILKIIIRQDGINTAFYTFLGLYSTLTLKSVMKFDVEIYDLNNNKTSLIPSVETVAGHKAAYYFGIGPVNEIYLNK